MSRLERWKEPKRISALLTGENEKIVSLLAETRKKESQGATSIVDIIQSSKEIIFDLKEGRPTFHHIIYLFNVGDRDLELCHALSQIHSEDETIEEIEESVIYTLALAALEDVPVYPNEEELSGELAKYHRKMLIDGFSMTDASGEKNSMY